MTEKLKYEFECFYCHDAPVRFNKNDCAYCKGTEVMQSDFKKEHTFNALESRLKWLTINSAYEDDDVVLIDWSDNSAHFSNGLKIIGDIDGLKEACEIAIDPLGVMTKFQIKQYLQKTYG